MKKKQERIAIYNPLVIMYPDPNDGKINCVIHPRKEDDYGHYGILICDLVRNVANAFNVCEEYVWFWVDKERSNPTDKPQKLPDTTWESLATENGAIRKLRD